MFAFSPMCECTIASKQIANHAPIARRAECPRASASECAANCSDCPTQHCWPLRREQNDRKYMMKREANTTRMNVGVPMKSMQFHLFEISQNTNPRKRVETISGEREKYQHPNISRYVGALISTYPSLCLRLAAPRRVRTSRDAPSSRAPPAGRASRTRPRPESSLSAKCQ